MTECAPEAVGELFDAFYPGIAALGDDVGGSEFAGQALAGFVAAHRDDPLGAELTGGQYRAQPDRAVTDHYHGLAGPGFGGNGPEPARTQHVGGRQEIRDEIGGGNLGGGDQSAVGQRDPHPLGLCAACGAEDLAVDARRLIAGAADLAGVVGCEERAHHELAGADRGDVRADLFDDADVFVAHRDRPVDRVGTAIRPQIRSADARRRQADDRVGRVLDGGFGPLLDPHVTRGVHHRRAHYRSPPQGCRAVRRGLTVQVTPFRRVLALPVETCTGSASHAGTRET